MKLLLILVSILFTANVNAAPYLVNKNVPSLTTHCGWAIDNLPKVEQPVGKASDGTLVCSLDIGNMTFGQHTVNSTTIFHGNDGMLESNIYPVTITKSSAPPYTRYIVNTSPLIALCKKNVCKYQ